MDVFSNLMVVGECLLDVQRTNAFIKAIKKVVIPGNVVLDVGTGSGILAMTAARAGAKHVYAIDIASDIVQFARKNVRNNMLHEIVSVEQCDAKAFSSTVAIDVVTMELMDTWLIGEQQGVVMNMLHENTTITADTICIPYRYQCAASLVSYDFSFYGNTMPFVIQARNFGVLERIKATLTPRVIANDIDFSKTIRTDVSLDIDFPVVNDGVCNAVLLESRTFLAEGIAVWGTTDMNMPVVIPISPKPVITNITEHIHISYQMGEGYGPLVVKWI